MRLNWFSYIRVTGLFLVLVYHFFPSILPGGFIGVDVFFTFSGYLITSLLSTVAIFSMLVTGRSALIILVLCDDAFTV